jgi:hypothetical protein
MARERLLAIAAQSLQSEAYKLMAITYFGRWSDCRIVHASGSSHKTIPSLNGKNALEEKSESASSVLILEDQSIDYSEDNGSEDLLMRRVD